MNASKKYTPLVDRVPYMNAFIPMGIMWLIFVSYPMIAPNVPQYVNAIIGVMGFFLGWVLYPLIILFLSTAVRPSSVARAVVPVAIFVCLGSAILQPFYNGMEKNVLRCITLVALLVVYVAFWREVMRMTPSNDGIYGIGLLKGVAALLFLPFFGVVYVNRVWRTLIR